MKRLIFYFLLSILLYGCSSPKNEIKNNMESVYQKVVTAEETTDGTKYSLFYSVLEKDKFNTDFRSIKESIDKIAGSLPTTEIDEVLSKDQNLCLILNHGKRLLLLYY